MYTHPNPSFAGNYRPAWGYQCPPVDTPTSTLPSLSTIALQDIVEGQQRATNGLVSLLSQERSTTESNTREHKQQLANLTSLSQHFLTFMPDVEQKFSALESTIRANCTNPDNVDLQNRVRDMVEVVAGLGRIAEGFACSTGLRLVPGFAPNPWAWVPANSQPLQQDPTSFSASFTQAPRLFPAAIPNSTRSSVFAHSTGPSRSVHWPSDLDVPTTSWAQPWSDPYFPVQFGTNTAYRASRSSLCGGLRPLSTGTCPGPYPYPAPPVVNYPPTASDPSLPPTPTPEGSPYGYRIHSPSLSLPIVQPPPPLGTVPPPRPSSSPSQTESVVGSMRRTPLSPITERTSQSSAVPLPPAFGRTPANGPSPSTSSIETFSTPSCIMMNPPAVPPSRFSVSTAPSGQIAPNWFGTIYPRSSSTVSSADGYTMASPPSPPHVQIPDLRPADTVRWSSLFPSAPIVVERPAPEGEILLRSSTPDESVASPMSSPVRSIVSYVGSSNPSTTSEPMTPLSRVSVDTPKPASDNTVPSTSAAIVTGTATASTSNAIAPSTAPVPPRNPLATQLVSFFFDTVQRLFKVPTTVDLSYGGFEVSFATDSIQWVNAFHDALFKMRDQDAEDAEDRRVFELMPAPANATLHRYIKDLARVRIDLAALQIGEGKGEEDPAVEQLLLRVKGEQETVQSWIRRVCEAAGALSIADPAFSPRK